MQQKRSKKPADMIVTVNGPVSAASLIDQVLKRRTSTTTPAPRRRGPATTHDWQTICGEIVRRCIDPKTKQLVLPKSESRLADDMLLFCQNTLGTNPPAPSEMRKAVRQVLAPLRQI